MRSLRQLSSKIRSKVLKVIIKAPMSNEINKLYEFAAFKFDGKKGKLWQENGLILLSPKATELLALLLERKGEFVSKEEIFDTVWKDTFVEDGVLTQNIYTLRKALGNDADGLPIIENKTRLGYRLTVPILLTDAETERHGDTEKTKNASIDNESDIPTIPASPRRKVAVSIFIGIALIAVAQISLHITANQWTP
jgi:DNA-binding winged helix-turn-helix (wHTH) protein